MNNVGVPPADKVEQNFTTHSLMCAVELAARFPFAGGKASKKEKENFKNVECFSYVVLVEQLSYYIKI